MSKRKDGKPRRHWKLSDETKELLSRIRKGKKFSDEHRANLSKALKGRPAPNKGKKDSDETRARKSAAQYKAKRHTRGVPLSDEHKEKLSKVRKGKHKSKEHCEKISKALKGKVRSEEHCRHLRGIKRTEETLKKLSESHKGKKLTPEHRLKIMEAEYGGFWYGSVRHYDGPKYCEKWTAELRERVRAYFGYRCIICGTPQNGRALHVHHVWYNKKACCDDSPRSLVPLCQDCHNQTTFGDRKYWSRYLQDIIDQYYGGRCWLTKDEYAAYITTSNNC